MISLSSFFTSYHYYPESLWKELFPSFENYLSTLEESNVPPLLHQQRSSARSLLLNETYGKDRFLGFLSLLLFRSLLTFASSSSTLSHKEQQQKTSSSFLSTSFPGIFLLSKSLFRKRWNRHRSFFSPLPWKLITSTNMSQPSILFTEVMDIPMILVGCHLSSSSPSSLLSEWYHATMVGYALNRLRFRMPFFSYTLGSLYAKADNLPKQESPWAASSTCCLLQECPNTEEVFSLAMLLREGRFHISDLIRITVEMAFYLYHVQTYYGMTHHFSSLDRIWIRSSSSTTPPPSLMFHTYGTEWVWTPGNYSLCVSQWERTTLRSSPALFYALPQTYIGPIDSFACGFSASEDLFVFLQMIQQCLVGCLTPSSTNMSSSIHFERMTQWKTMLQWILVLYTEWYQFPLTSAFWLETPPAGLTIYHSPAYHKTPLDFLLFMEKHANVWTSFFEMDIFPLTRQVRQQYFPSSITKSMTLSLVPAFHDFVFPSFYDRYDQHFRSRHWFSVKGEKEQSVETMLYEAKSLIELWNSGNILDKLPVMELFDSRHQWILSSQRIIQETYLKPTSTLFPQVQTTVALFVRLHRWMETVYALKSFSPQEFVSLQQQMGTSSFQLLVDLYQDIEQMSYLETITSVLTTWSTWNPSWNPLSFHHHHLQKKNSITTTTTKSKQKQRQKTDTTLSSVSSVSSISSVLGNGQGYISQGPRFSAPVLPAFSSSTSSSSSSLPTLFEIKRPSSTIIKQKQEKTQQKQEKTQQKQQKQEKKQQKEPTAFTVSTKTMSPVPSFAYPSYQQTIPYGQMIPSPVNPPTQAYYPPNPSSYSPV